MSDYLILDGDQGIATFKAAEDNNCTVYIKGVHVRFDTAPITREELEIIYESDVQADRNKQLYSKDMKGEKDFDNLFDDPIELKENERLRIGYPNTDRNPFRVYPSYDVWHNGKIIISIDKSDHDVLTI